MVGSLNLLPRVVARLADGAPEAEGTSNPAKMHIDD
jgi:hypothetical protein